MRIKEVCEKTGLTRKAVRFYTEEGLISPGIEPKTHNDYRDYSEKDVERLQLIMALRSLRLSIGDIREILHSPQNSGAVFERQKELLKKEQGEITGMVSVLEELGNCSDLSILAGRIERLKSGRQLEFSPNFAQFEELSKVRRQEFSDGKAVIDSIEKAARKKRTVKIFAAAAVMAVLFIIGGFIYWENMEVGCFYGGGPSAEFIEIQTGDFGKEGYASFAVLRFDDPPEYAESNVLRLPFAKDTGPLTDALIPGGTYIGMNIRIAIPRNEARELGLLSDGVFNSDRALELFYTNEDFARRYGGITHMYSGYSARPYLKDFEP